MTKEQEEVINKLRKITNRQILYGNKFGITIEGFREFRFNGRIHIGFRYWWRYLQKTIG